MLTAKQWGEWLQFYSLEPWGFDITDTHVGIIASTVMRSQGARCETKDYMLGPNLPARAEMQELEEREEMEERAAEQTERAVAYDDPLEHLRRVFPVGAPPRAPAVQVRPEPAPPERVPVGSPFGPADDNRHTRG